LRTAHRLRPALSPNDRKGTDMNKYMKLALTIAAFLGVLTFTALFAPKAIFIMLIMGIAMLWYPVKKMMKEGE
jgi:hypothetical protein